MEFLTLSGSGSKFNSRCGKEKNILGALGLHEVSERMGMPEKSLWNHLSAAGYCYAIKDTGSF